MALQCSDGHVRLSVRIGKAGGVYYNEAKQ